MVSQCLYPFDVWQWIDYINVNMLESLGATELPVDVLLCLLIFYFWHCTHVCAHCVQLLCMFIHMYLSEISLIVALPSMIYESFL